MAFDLTNIKSKNLETGVEMKILHPVTGEPLVDENGEAAALVLVGQDSALYKKTVTASTNRRIKGGRSVKLSAERIDADALDLLCECTLQWSGITINGEVPKTAREIYTQYKWIYEQADAFIHDRANYLGN